MNIDTIELVDGGLVQVRLTEPVIKNGEVVGQKYHRSTFYPGQDVSGQLEAVSAFCANAWTPEVIASYDSSIKPIT
jgi:hypothetical protein